MRTYISHKTSEGNALQAWHKVKNPLIVAYNFLLISLAKIFPSLAVRRFLLRLTGMRVGRGAAVGLDAQFDIFFPELIELGEDCIIGYGATILAHEYLIDEYRIGKVRIGRRAVIGANSTILCGTDIGDGAVVGAGAVVTDNVPNNTFVTGIPAKKKRSFH